MGLDGRVILRKPQKVHLIGYCPREWPMMNPIPLLDVLRESVGRKIRLNSLIVIDFQWISEQHMITHVLADRGEVDASGNTQTRELSRIANSGEHQKLRDVEDPALKMISLRAVTCHFRPYAP